MKNLQEQIEQFLAENILIQTGAYYFNDVKKF